MKETAVVRKPRAAKAAAESALNRDELEQTLGFNLRRAWVQMEQVFAKHLSTAGITPQLYAMLIVIQSNPGCTITELCRTIGVSQTNIVPAIDQLMTRGLVFRDFASHDRRAKRLSLTENGAATLDKLRAMHQPVTDHFAAKLGAANMKKLIELLALMGDDAR